MGERFRLKRLPTLSRKPTHRKRLQQVEVFYDGDCPLCMKEINLLRWCDRQQRIQFTDISADDFDPTHYGYTQQQFMDRIRGRLPGGQWIEGVEVFRRLYAAIGRGPLVWLLPLVWLSRIPGLSHVLDLGYCIFAKNRLRLTGRCQESCKV
ncbi:MAG: DUF393 domain-containing protein [Pirellulaceae bacterium]